MADGVKEVVSGGEENGEETVQVQIPEGAVGGQVPDSVDDGDPGDNVTVQRSDEPSSSLEDSINSLVQEFRTEGTAMGLSGKALLQHIESGMREHRRQQRDSEI